MANPRYISSLDELPEYEKYNKYIHSLDELSDEELETLKENFDWFSKLTLYQKIVASENDFKELQLFERLKKQLWNQNIH